MHFNERFEKVKTQTATRRAVDGDRHIQFAGFLINGKKTFVAVTFAQPCNRRQHRHRHAELIFHPAHFLDGCGNVVDRDQRRTEDPRRAFHINCVQPGIISPGDFNRPGRILNQAESQGSGRIDDGCLNAAFIEKGNPGIAVRIIAQAGGAHSGQARPTIERRKWRKCVGPALIFAGAPIVAPQEFQDLFAAFGDMTVTIDHRESILSHGEPPFIGLGPEPPARRYLSIDCCGVVKHDWPVGCFVCPAVWRET